MLTFQKINFCFIILFLRKRLHKNKKPKEFDSRKLNKKQTIDTKNYFVKSYFKKNKKSSALLHERKHLPLCYLELCR